MSPRVTIGIVVVSLFVVGAAIVDAMPWHALVPAAPTQLPGWVNYDRFCLPCHGVAGDGAGPAAPFTRARPRDFTRGDFAWRSTASGQPPTRVDLRAAIAKGVAGTSMPGFDVALTPAQIDELVDVVRAFAPPTAPAPVVAIGAPPATIVARGADLWTARGCVACHGVDGTGNPAIADVYDLTTSPLHRPDAARDPRRAIVTTIATGAGSMPGYTLSTDELYALADHVHTLQGAQTRAAPAADIEPHTIARDQLTKLSVGFTLAPQGAPPASLTPVAASLYAHQCARCHAKQYREFTDSRHNLAMSPGFRAQTLELPPARVASCRRCHAPLAEQATEPALAAQGVQCAGCHVRGWTRHGPPNVAPSLLPDPAYPLVLDDAYERADFCMPCHQLAPRHAVNGRPLLDTYREWLEGPYLRRGVQCQHCHMPNREHTWKGIHDPDAFRQAVALAGHATRTGQGITVAAALRNVGAGHDLPTTPTPAVYLVLQLRDARGTVLAQDRLRIGRHIASTATGWTELADTRIPPGEAATITRTWAGPAVATATTARIADEV
ncbi:MAG: c-type cytochrome, partial [Proteobacteria bacterium]|nr:c-type cytochrome [Pseudomonadota bacterium]